MGENDSKLTKEEIQMLCELSSNIGKKKAEEKWGANKIHKLINAGYLEEVGLVFKEISLTDKGQKISESETKHPSRLDKFQALLGANGFETVEFLPDGGVKFERRYVWRTVKCKMTTLDKFDEYEAKQNMLNLFILLGIAIQIGLLTFLILIGIYVVLGLRTKENILKEVEKICSSSEKT